MKFVTSLFSVACLVSLACGAAPADDGTVETTVESEVRSKIPFQVVPGVSVPDGIGDDEFRRVITTRSDFEAVFGDGATPPVDFRSHWLVFFTPGTQPTGGFGAGIASVAASSTGATLYVTTKLEAPGDDCVVHQALTKPAVLVKFARPRPTPTYFRFTRTERERHCRAPIDCDAIICAQGTICVDGLDGDDSHCEAYRTCHSTGLRCGAGSHCEDNPIVCLGTPCVPTAPTCVDGPSPCKLVSCTHGKRCIASMGLARCE